MRADGSKRLTVLSEAERLALYGLPDFDDFQRAEFFALSAAERALVDWRKGLAEQVWCLLQIGYFKAKQAFFGFSWPDVPLSDIAFLMERYFPGSALTPQPIRANEHYAQRREIAGLFGYRLWADTDRAAVVGKAGLLAKRDVAATFILTELLAFLATRRIVRPGYTTLQGIISEVLTAERRRLEHLVEDGLDEEARAALQGLLVREDTLSELAALKQDAKHFGYRMMAMERQKRATLAPLHRVAKALLPRLDISQQNVAYYASLAHYYTVYDLRRLKPGQTHLYLLCYAWQRFRQLTDSLVEAFGFHMGQLEAQTKEESEAAFAQVQAGSRRDPGSAAYSCSMSTTQSTTPRRSRTSATGPSRSCRGRRCSAPARGFAKSRSASWNCAGRRWTARRHAARNICARSPWRSRSRPPRRTIRGSRLCVG
jgi:hypothetical protein